MRSEHEMYDLIIGVANKDERIRAVYMNGSRSNPNAPRDMFQDYDIVYVVKETASFVKDTNWITVFGELLMMQEPDKMDQLKGLEMNFDRSYTYLMLFKDGNRIDLHIETLESMRTNYGSDSLTIPLLDKDNCLPSIAASSDKDYYVKRPTEAEFMSCCNEFWWCLQNVAKGIWRDELPYSKQMFDSASRLELEQMVSWWIGLKQHYQISTGKMGKYFKRYLPESHWAMYELTYSDADYERLWDSVFAACELFRLHAKEIASYFGYSYSVEDDTNMTNYLKRVRALPANATTIA